MSSNEDYLDSLLKAAIDNEGEETAEEKNADNMEILQESGKEPAGPAEGEGVPEQAVIAEPEEKPVIAEPETAHTEPEISQIVDDDPNKKMSADDIAALFAAASAEEAEAGESVVEESEQSSEEPKAAAGDLFALEEPEAPLEESKQPSEELEAAAGDLFALEEPEAPLEEPKQPSEEPEAAAEDLFALEEPAEPVEEEDEPEQSGEEMPEHEGAVAEPEDKSAEAESGAVHTEPEISQIADDDPNKKMSADDIAALFAAASAEELEAGNPVIEEPIVEEPEPMHEETGQAVEELEPETGEPQMVLEEPESGAAAEELGQTAEEEAAFAESFALEESGEEESGYGSGAEESVMDDEELDALLGVSGGISGMDDDKDITEMIDDMDTDDADLAEISELLKKSDSNELVDDDDMLSMLEGLTGFDGEDAQPEVLEEVEQEMPARISPEPEEEAGGKKSGKKKKEKKSFFGRKKKKKEGDLETDAPAEDVVSMEEGGEGRQETSSEFDFFGGEESAKDEDGALSIGEKSVIMEDNSLQAELGLVPKKQKPEEKKGFLSKLFAILTEEIGEEEEEQAPTEEAEGEDGKSKKKKKKKGKKGAENTTDADDNAAILDEMDSEEEGNKSKKKKKEKKPKKEKVKKEPEKDDGKKLPKKLVIRIFLLCFSLMALLIIAANLIPSTITLQKARRAFYKKDYLTTYQEMYGRELNESDEIILNKATIVLKVQRKLSAFRNFHSVGMELEALNALLEGQVVYDKVCKDAEGYGIKDEIDVIYAGILQALSDTYGISEEAARQINALETDLAYTKAVRAVIGVDNDSEALQGIDLSTEEETEPVEEETDPVENYEDVLPEELQ